MSYGRQSSEELVHERPAWIIPAAVAAGVLILSGFFLYYYFGPTTKELLGLDPRASIDDAPVEAIVADRRFLIPENYTRYPNQRGGGVRREIDMHALWPDMAPYSAEHEQDFANNGPASDVIFFSLKETSTPLSSDKRLKNIYSKYLVSPEPEKDATGLDRFAFRENSGYGDQFMLVGQDADQHTLLITCDRDMPLVESPNCSRTLLVAPNLELTYRYKRTHLKDWAEIDRRIRALAASFDTTRTVEGLQGSFSE
ncbi:hypothetical protein FHS78_000475 [Parvibaculum indicum]|uniref:hypothetical protein n=1 Tax=Parvibaculum indicum TaxID=562969 RepID=UPI00141FFA60|nr:hypothetical protein [Parvibaculum indicum]NIJ40220.1 hypothetical protein [Parvibaculum indicum]